MLGMLVGQFLANTPELIARVCGDAATSVKDIEIAAHSLRSTCARFGAKRIAALAAQAEHAAREGALEEAKRLGREMREEFARFEARLKLHPVVAASL